MKKEELPKHRLPDQGKYNIPYNQNCCKECRNAYRRAWVKLNKGKQREYQNKWDKLHPELIRRMRRREHYRHRDQYIRRSARWRKLHQSELNMRRNTRRKVEQDVLLQQNPLVAIMQPYFKRLREKAEAPAK